jgi:CDP-4-dehydro-6-deoxyglucose reductase, E3
MMARQHRITLNGDTFFARSGQVLLDAALIAGVEIPHDCRAGRCGTCVTQVQRGVTLGGEMQQRGMIRACQARVFSELNLTVEALPTVGQTEARLTRLVDLTPDVAELTIAPAAPHELLPGQYCRFAFRGFPARNFSPTVRLDGRTRPDRIHLHVKRVRNGRVSTNLGGRIKPGHRLTLFGPFGHAFLRPRHDSRLVLVAGGTGFAPMWAIGHAALCENALRPIVFVVGVREQSSLYMAPALNFASRFPNVSIVATTEARRADAPNVRPGRPSDHVPQLDASDVVYAAGAPSMVEAVEKRARAAQATFYSDPFEPADSVSEDWVTRAFSWLRAR